MSEGLPTLWYIISRLTLRQKWNVLGVLVSAFVAGYGIGVWYQNYHVQRLELEIERLRENSTVLPHRQALILSPKDRSYVEQYVTVSGSYTDIGGRAIWVLIYSHKLKRYFPARTKARTTNATTWMVEDLQIGTEDDYNSTDFDVAVFLVEPDSEGFTGYLNSIDAEGFVAPFGGMYEQDRITVFRRKVDDQQTK